MDILQKGGEDVVWHRAMPILYLNFCSILVHEVKGYMGIGELKYIIFKNYLFFIGKKNKIY